MSTCPSHDQLSRLALGLLSADEMQSVALHVDDCLACGSMMQRLDGHGDVLLTNLRSRPASSDAVVAPGTVLGDYVIDALIGSGGMGQVFRASHRRMKRDVALKVLASGMLDSVEAVQRFHREVEMAAKLVHPNIAMAYDAGEHRGTHYLVLEYIDGQDLARLVRERGPQPLETAVDLVLQAARGLAHAHRQGIVHRDIKPANLMLDRRGNVKVLDLGLSRLQASASQDDPREPDAGIEPGAGSDSNLTMAIDGAKRGSILGTAGYLAPEQAAHPEAADARADIYALGCTLYFLLTGRNPLVRESVSATVRAHRDEPMPGLEQFRVRAPRGLETALHRMLAKRQQDRFASMDQVLASLGRFTSAARMRRRTRMAITGAMGLLLIVLLGISFWAASQRRPAGASATPTTTTRPVPDAGRLPFDATEARRLQARWADYLGVPVEQSNSLGMRLALIPPGEFRLGVRQKIRLTRPYYMTTCEVTVGQFRQFVNATGYRTRAEREGGVVDGANEPRPDVNWQHAEFPQTDEHPVVQMSYEDAAAFCEWLSRAQKRHYYVPTEAQWEWAARAGTAADHHWDDRVEPFATYAWVAETSGGHTHPVGQLKPNAWGLFDTHGNAVEWCSDYYAEWPARDKVHDDVLEVLVDPAGPIYGRTRTLRGTAYRSAGTVGVISRGNYDRNYSGFGFRIAREIAK
jgi:serine/threonine protein kinase